MNRYLASYYEKPAGTVFYHDVTAEARAAFFSTASNGVFFLCPGVDANAVVLHYKAETGVGAVTLSLSEDGKQLTLPDGDSYSLVSYFARYSDRLLEPVDVASFARAHVTQRPVPAAQASGLALKVSFTIAAATLESIKVVGEGAYGEVSYGLWHGHTDVAIKALKVGTLTPEVTAAFRHEAQVMANLRSPRVVQLYGVCFEEGLRLVMEYLPEGSLYGLLHREVPLTWGQRVCFATDIGEGLHFLHAQNPVILHRDLKSLNVLLDVNYRAKLTDFGLAQVKQEVHPHAETAPLPKRDSWRRSNSEVTDLGRGAGATGVARHPVVITRTLGAQISPSYVEPRSTSRVGSTVCAGGCSPASRASSRSAITRPISSTGWCTLVSPGSV
jgi:hypothetical protein